MTFEQALEATATLLEAWNAFVQSISDVVETLSEVTNALASAPEIWPGRKSVPPKKYGMSLHKRRYKAVPVYQYLPSALRNRPYQRRAY